MALAEGKHRIWIYHQSQRGFVDPTTNVLQRHAQIKREWDPDAPLRFTYESLTGAFLTTPRAERALVIGWQE